MGLLGLFRAHHEAVTASVKEWLGKDYIKDVLGGTALFGLEEFTTEFVTDLAGLTGWKKGLAKNLGRLVFSAIYYYGLGRYAPGVAFIASVLPVSMVVFDGVAWLLSMAFKIPVARRFDDYGAMAAEVIMAKLGGVSTSYGITPTQVTTVSTVAQQSTQAAAAARVY